MTDLDTHYTDGSPKPANVYYLVRYEYCRHCSIDLHVENYSQDNDGACCNDCQENPNWVYLGIRK